MKIIFDLESRPKNADDKKEYYVECEFNNMELKTKYYKKDILIVGFGKTGKSIFKFFKNQKVNIFIYDDNLDIIKNKLKSKNFFNEKEKSISDFFTIFVSPGISKSHKLIKKAAKKIIRVAKTRPDLYSKADVVYARIIKRRIKENENLTEEKV